jgi:hypothetical protein
MVSEVCSGIVVLDCLRVLLPLQQLLTQLLLVCAASTAAAATASTVTAASATASTLSRLLAAASEARLEQRLLHKMSSRYRRRSYSSPVKVSCGDIQCFAYYYITMVLYLCELNPEVRVEGDQRGVHVSSDVTTTAAAAAAAAVVELKQPCIVSLKAVI